MRNFTYAVSSLRQYENGDTHFGCDKLCGSAEKAKKFIQQDMKDTLEEEAPVNPDDVFIDLENYTLKIGSLCSVKWRIDVLDPAV